MSGAWSLFLLCVGLGIFSFLVLAGLGVAIEMPRIIEALTDD